MIQIILMVTIFRTQNMFQDNVIDIFAKKHRTDENHQNIKEKQTEVSWDQ